MDAGRTRPAQASIRRLQRRLQPNREEQGPMTAKVKAGAEPAVAAAVAKAKAGRGADGLYHATWAENARAGQYSEYSDLAADQPIPYELTEEGKGQAESNAEAWGGRGPSASYTE